MVQTFLFSESMRISSSSSFSSFSIVSGAAGSAGADITAAGAVREGAGSDSSLSCIGQKKKNQARSIHSPILKIFNKKNNPISTKKITGHCRQTSDTGGKMVSFGS